MFWNLGKLNRYFFKLSNFMHDKGYFFGIKLLDILKVVLNIWNYSLNDGVFSLANHEKKEKTMKN